MPLLVGLGAGITVLGLLGVLYCILSVSRARKRGLEDAEMRQHLQRIVAINLIALFLSAIGLGCLVIGLILQ